MKTFILIDGNAILHRAYHALPKLTSKNGDVVNAVYGFFSMFINLFQQYKPEYIAVCFDRPKPTFRQELFVGYQQHRPQMADDLVPQIGTVHAILEKMKVPIFEVDGYEADDLIGTIAAQAVQDTKILRYKDIKNKKRKSSNILISQYPNISPDIEVIIVSGDRDLLQLVNDHVKVLAPIVGLTKTILFDATTVEEKFGVKPSQIVDYKALVGDPSDGYPGVSGIGPKTAADLLRTHGTFENLYQQVGQLPEKIATKLATDAEQASLAKKLATIVIDAPVTLRMGECSVDRLDKEALAAEFEKLGFKSLVKRLEQTSNNKVQENTKQLGLL
ncbi:MAG: hypothetical protein HYT11_03285 [Candidatus Levybacteria bacterium]|nr:hypothetical protein [Candidatus Levybacteria bacterium]